MIGYDYPTFYRCTDCGAETSIRRSDTRGLDPNPDGRSRHELVLWGRGWEHLGRSGVLLCPDCIGDTDR